MNLFTIVFAGCGKFPPSDIGYVAVVQNIFGLEGSFRIDFNDAELINQMPLHAIRLYIDNHSSLKEVTYYPNQPFSDAIGQIVSQHPGPIYVVARNVLCLPGDQSDNIPPLLESIGLQRQIKGALFVDSYTPEEVHKPVVVASLEKLREQMQEIQLKPEVLQSYEAIRKEDPFGAPKVLPHPNIPNTPYQGCIYVSAFTRRTR